ncbi:MAG: hypothetical protein KDK39_01355 [Leptospiraceae bacterium]|nr:hypothetical protein [Leptospiraceae bacterium]
MTTATQSQIRTVDVSGRVRWNGRRFKANIALAGKQIELVEMQSGLFWRAKNGKLTKLQVSERATAERRIHAPNIQRGPASEHSKPAGILARDTEIAAPAVKRRTAGLDAPGNPRAKGRIESDRKASMAGVNAAGLRNRARKIRIAVLEKLSAALMFLSARFVLWSVYIDAAKTNQRMVDEADRRNGKAADEN